MYTILICDDEPDIRAALRIYLTGEGYDVLEAGTGDRALELMAEREVHLVLMDIMMPGMDGMTATAKLRETSNVPVILITAKSEDNDKILGLTVGADDYVTKPFNPLEGLARVRAQLRRYAQLGGMAVKNTALVCGGIVMDDEAKRVTLHGEEIALTPTEYDILRLCFKTRERSFPPGRSTLRCGGTSRCPRRERCRCTSAISGKSWRSIRPVPDCSRWYGAKATSWRIKENEQTSEQLRGAGFRVFALLHTWAGHHGLRAELRLLPL